MICQPKNTAKIFVVDAQPKDYSGVVGDAVYDSVQFKFFGNGRDALSSQLAEEPEMWVVNMNLPDMSGTDLQELLRARGSKVPVMLVGDQYRVEDEIDARSSGATMYFAKPLQREWLLASGQHAA